MIIYCKHCGAAETIAKTAVQNGMKTLKDYAVWILKNGWTTVDEVFQVLLIRE